MRRIYRGFIGISDRIGRLQKEWILRLLSESGSLHFLANVKEFLLASRLSVAAPRLKRGAERCLRAGIPKTAGFSGQFFRYIWTE